MKAKNILEGIPERIPDEVFEELAGGDSMRIERIVSSGHASPEGFWYDQELHEWVLLLKGSAGLRFEESEEVLVLKPGDWVNIAAHTRHRVEWTDPVDKTIWLAVHYS